MGALFDRDKALPLPEIGDTIFYLQSADTPFMRLLPRGTAPKQLLASWPVGSWPNRAFKGTPDGTDKANYSHTNRKTIQSTGMWLMSDGWQVSRLANITRSAGVKGKEKAKQQADDALAFGLQFEKQTLSDMPAAIEDGDQAYQSRGVFDWLSADAQAVLPVPDGYRPSADMVYTGTLANFTPAQFETMVEAAATQKHGTVNLDGFVGIKLKTKMSTWIQRDSEAAATNQVMTQYNLNAKEKRLIRVVNFFEFEGGTVRTIPTWNLLCDPDDGEPTAHTLRSGAFVDLSQWELCYYEPIRPWIESEKTGGPRGCHDCVYILKCNRPDGQLAAKIGA
jgi:hypothetical protein